jgi:hypothetical protein
MAATNPGFEVVGGTDAEPQATSTQVLMLTMALKALSLRALTAAMDLFCLITCAGEPLLNFSGVIKKTRARGPDGSPYG